MSRPGPGSAGRSGRSGPCPRRVAVRPAGVRIGVLTLAGIFLAWPAASQTAAADPTDVVRVERMGGFAGVHESWTLQASGKVWFVPVPGTEASLLRTLAPELMEQVRGALKTGLGRVAGVGSGVECLDCFFYRIVVLGPEGGQDVVVGEHRLAGAAPAVRRLVGLVAGHGPPPFSLPGGLGVP